MRKFVLAVLFCLSLVGTVVAGERWDNQFSEPHLKGWIDTEEQGFLGGGHSFGLFGESYQELGFKENPSVLGGEFRLEGGLHFSEWDYDFLRTEVWFDLHGPVDEGFWWIRPGFGFDFAWTDGYFEQITTTTTTTDVDVKIETIKIRPPWACHKHKHDWHEHKSWHKFHGDCDPIIIIKETLTETTVIETVTYRVDHGGALEVHANAYLQAGIGRTLGGLGHGAFWIEGGRRERFDNWHFSMNWIFGPLEWVEFDMIYEWNWFDDKQLVDYFIAEFGSTLTGRLTKQVAVFGRVSGWITDQDSRGVVFRGGVQIHFR